MKNIDTRFLKPQHNFILNDFFLCKNYLSSNDHKKLISSASAKLSRLARGDFLENHFDNVITGYKEASVSAWGSAFNNIDSVWEYNFINKFKKSVNEQLLKMGKSSVEHWHDPHILELRDGNSGIGPHVDNINASGSVVAGVCLESDSVLVFRNVNDKDSFMTALVPAGSMYIQCDRLRYEFTHEIPLDPELHSFLEKKIERRRRISILIRDIMNKPSR